MSRYGIKLDEKLQEKIERRDARTLVKITIVEEVFHEGDLLDELVILEGIDAPSDVEVLALAKERQLHPFYEGYRDDRIREIKEELERWSSN